MGRFDAPQALRYWRAPTLTDYKVCLVTVCNFTFIFHSVEQLETCSDYYIHEHHPSSRLLIYTENLGGDNSETQRWFEKLPQYLLEKPKRSEVVKTLKRAIQDYSKIQPAQTKNAKTAP